MRLLLDIETSVAVRSETDPRDPESAAGWTSKRADEQARRAADALGRRVWHLVCDRSGPKPISACRAPRHCKTFKFELPHSCFVETISYRRLNLLRRKFYAFEFAVSGEDDEIGELNGSQSH